MGRLTAVFLTHLHSDHVVGLPDLWLTCRRLEPLGYLPPAEYELQFEQLHATPRLLEHSTT